jgi:hypothetical protein
MSLPGGRIDLLFHFIDPRGQMRDLVQQLATDPRASGGRIRTGVLNDLLEARRIADPLGRDIPNSYR